MLKNLLFSIAFLLGYNISFSQCTPIDCAASLPAYGGLCDEFLANGLVNATYLDNESFILTDNCFDAGLFDPSLAGNNIKISNIDNITFSSLPNGLSASPNQTSYSPPSGSYIAGCVEFSGTPTEAGVFEASIDFLADVALCPFNIPLADQVAGFAIEITILPDPNFSGLSSTYCTNDAAVTLTPTGTLGGTFSGPGITGNSFDPNTAGVGTHTITYTVSAQEGTAILPATNAMNMIITVSTGTIYYADTDNDGYGDPNNTATLCGPTTGYVLDNTDCDDTVNSINPGAADIPNNGIDEDCDGFDSTVIIDMDMDGFDVTVDCNDNNPNVYPGATEVCNGKDDDCNGEIDDTLPQNTYYADTDNDGYGDPNNVIMDCDPITPTGYVTNSDDCDDTNNEIYLGATEICDGFDNNCDGNIDEGLALNTFYADLDNDSYGDANNTITTCFFAPPAGYISDPSDCDDTDPNINPGATEICDGVDNNCSNSIDEGLTEFTYFADTDNDTYGDPNNPLTTCENTAPTNYVTDNTDCDDTDPNINPNATEACDGIDNNCSNSIDEGLTEFTYYEDADNDTYGDPNTPLITCENSAPNGYVTDNTDCNDTDSAINPGATEIVDNGIDEDCSGEDLVNIQDIESLGISITPNPASNILIIKSTNSINASYEVYNTIGEKVIFENNIQLQASRNIDVSMLSNGAYFLKIRDDNNNIGVHKFTIIK